MELLIREELYQTPFKICFGINCNGNVALNNNGLEENSKDSYNPSSNNYLLRNHQHKSAVSKTTNRSQEGLEMQVKNQEAKRIESKNEMLITALLKDPVQSKRSQKKRKRRNKYLYYRTRNDS